MSNNITILFSIDKEVSQGKFSTIQYQVKANLNETLKELISRICKSLGLSTNNYKFIFNQKTLDDSNTSTLAQIGLTNNSKIQARYILKECMEVKDPNEDKNNSEEEIKNIHNPFYDYASGNNNNHEQNQNHQNNIGHKFKQDNDSYFPKNDPHNKEENKIMTPENKNQVYIGQNPGSKLGEIMPNPSTNPQIISDGDFQNNNNHNNNNINPLKYEISIKFIKYCKNSKYDRYDGDLKGILKLCFLNEIASILNEQDLKILFNNGQISEMVFFILQILKKCYVNYNNKNEAASVIKKVIGKDKGCNILNFSNFVEEEVSQDIIKVLINYLSQRDKMKTINSVRDLQEIKLHLAKYENYMDFFEKQIRKSLKDSVFEFSPISLVVIDREDFDKFEQEKKKCPNLEMRLLYHGTQEEPTSCILTAMFKRSEGVCCQHGEGVYFTDSLDYCYFYGGKDNRCNMNKIPPVGDCFTAICSWVYNDKNGKLKVNDYNTRKRPGKNQINFAYAASTSETIQNPNPHKFYAKEYVVYELEQICPIISVKFKREEFCVIWRDNNFSKEKIFGGDWDDKFKSYLRARIKYIEQLAKYNVYTFENTKEALECVNRKKYNKIILISNVGTDFGGQHFVEEARKIIKNDSIVLFSSFSKEHLNWIVTWKNALFSEDETLTEEFLESFSDKNKMIGLIKKFEIKYNVKFNFDNNFLYFPRFKKEGNYSNLNL